MVQPVNPSAAMQGSGGSSAQQTYTKSVMKTIFGVVDSIMPEKRLGTKDLDKAVGSLLDAIENPPSGLNNTAEVGVLKNLANGIIQKGASEGTQMGDLNELVWNLGQSDQSFRDAMGPIFGQIKGDVSNDNYVGAVKSFAIMGVDYARSLNKGVDPSALANDLAYVVQAENPIDLHKALETFNTDFVNFLDKQSG